MMPSETLAAQLITLNNAQRGSFGEFVFAEIASTTKRWEVVPQHRQRIDFVVNGVPVDVKATVRGLNRAAGPVRKFSGARVEGVRYAMVEFISDGARVSLEGDLMELLQWTDLKPLWVEWRRGVRMTGGRVSNPSNEELRALRTELTAYFHSLGLHLRMLYRTCQAEFGREAPANLRPSSVRPGRVTVYIEFGDRHIRRANIRRIMAFSDARCDELPELAKTHLHKLKIDLERIPAAFIFADLDDLKARFGPEGLV